MKFFRRLRRTGAPEPDAPDIVKVASTATVPDGRVTANMRAAVEHILTGSADSALVIYEVGEVMYYTHLGGVNRVKGIGLAQTYLMSQSSQMLKEDLRDDIEPA